MVVVVVVAWLRARKPFQFQEKKRLFTFEHNRLNFRGKQKNVSLLLLRNTPSTFDEKQCIFNLQRQLPPNSRVYIHHTLDDQAEDGGIFVYDLLQSSVVPVASAQLPRGSGGGGGGVNPAKSRGVAAAAAEAAAAGGGGAAVAAYSVTFNPRQRDLVATGDSLGRVIVWRTSWPLSNKRPGEDLGLERLFKGSVGDVSLVGGYDARA